MTDFELFKGQDMITDDIYTHQTLGNVDTVSFLAAWDISNVLPKVCDCFKMDVVFFCLFVEVQ